MKLINKFESLASKRSFQASLIIRIVFVIASMLILLSGISILLNHQGFALKLFVNSFWLLLLGVILYNIELKK